MLNFFLTRILPWLLVVALAVGLWFALFGGEDPVDPEKEHGATVITHHMVVDKIESLGKLELTRYYLKDIVEQKEVIGWWPDDKIVLIISGEVIGCIDLTKIDSNAVVLGKDSVIITLPPPEICTFKINHQESKVYYINTAMWKSVESDANFIDKGYKLAEKNLEETAIRMNIFDETRKNAKLILQPILESMTGKKVVLIQNKPEVKVPFPL